jgi:hypothetical protein
VVNFSKAWDLIRKGSKKNVTVRAEADNGAVLTLRAEGLPVEFSASAVIEHAAKGIKGGASGSFSGADATKAGSQMTGETAKAFTRVLYGQDTTAEDAGDDETDTDLEKTAGGATAGRAG